MSEPSTITVDAVALRQVLQALEGPGYMIRELQALRGFTLGEPSPITILVNQYNAWANVVNKVTK